MRHIRWPIAAALFLASVLSGSASAASRPADVPKPKAVITDDFASDKAWDHARGDWHVKDGKLVQTKLEGDCRTLLGDVEITDCYTLEVDARKLGGAEGFLIIFRYQGKTVWWNIAGWGNTYSLVEEIPPTRTGFTVQTGRLYHIKVAVNRSALEGWIDGKRQFRVDVPPDQVGNRTSGTIGLGTWRTAAEYGNFRLTIYPGTPPPPPRPFAEVLAEERPKDWLYEEVVAMSATAHHFYGRLRPRLPAPAVAAPPKLDGTLDDQAWAAATSWRLWVPTCRRWADRSWEKDPPVAPLELLCCRQGNDLYVAARWNPELGGPPLAVKLDGGKVGNGQAEWCLRGKANAAFDLVGRPLGAIADVRCRVEIAAAQLAPKEAGAAASTDAPPEGLSVREREMRLGKAVFRLPIVRYREPVGATLAECEAILRRSDAPLPGLARQVAALREQATRAAATAPPDAWRALFRRARALKSECLLAEARTLPPVAILTRQPWGRPFGIGTYICWDIVRTWGCGIRLFDPGKPDAPARRLFRDRRGVLFDMNVSYDARTLFFALRRRTKSDSYHLYEIGADGTGLKQLTTGPYHDAHPLLLPSGELLFVSTRRESYSMCQPGAASCMFVMDRDGTNIRRVSANTLSDHSPQMMPDGRVIFTRWEYIDKGLFLRQSLWTMSPDGTRIQLFFGNTIRDPNTFWQARPIPGSPAVVATFGPHHGNPHGAIGIVTNRNGMEAPRGHGFRWITREFPTVGDRNYFWAYRDPFPVGQHTFLVAYGGSDARRFRIFLLDDRDNRECIYSDPAISCYNPLPLQPTQPPPAISPADRQEGAPTGTFLLVDVYRGLPNVQRGEVKAIQIMEQVPKPCNMRGLRSWDMDPLMSRGTYYAKRVWGTVPVEPDGSAYFRAPALREIYFQALDASGKELQRMGSATQLMPGERQSCIGCHEGREQAPPNQLPMAVRRPPSEMKPPEWGNGGLMDFVKIVQPVFDKHCVRCHSGPSPKKGLDLSDDKTRYFNMAYNHLIDRKLVDYLWLNRAHHNVFKPRTTGAQVSRLLERIDTDHCGHRLPLAGRRRVYNWIDSNVAYYGTYEHVRPGTSGCRDLWDGDWYVECFAPAYVRRCGGCHKRSMAYPARPIRRDRPAPDHRWINLTHPEWSRTLTAPLAKAAGGLGLCHPKDKATPPVFATTADPDYAAMLDAIRGGRAAMLAAPRVDMPGAEPRPYTREFGRVFTGFAGP